MGHRDRRRLLAGIVATALLGSGCGSSVPEPTPPSSGPQSPAPTVDPTGTTTGRPTDLPPDPPTDDPTAEPTGPVDDVKTRNASTRKRFHRLNGQSYRFENSYRGLDYAAAHGYLWIDIDTNYCLDDTHTRRIPIATHWRHLDTEGFDPGGRYAPATVWSDLTFSQVRELRSADNPPYELVRMVDMVRYAARVGMEGIEWEVKAGVGFEKVETYREVLRVARRLGIAIEVKTLYELGGAKASLRRLRAAKQAGATTMLIVTRKQPRILLSPGHETFVDYVRGKWGRV
ncbi:MULTISPECIES: hypothetical protein [unclassified Nocardioides]|uniref:hypothetical protein n=1 Tax=unclassified Nocardioides TaxID=2615069 RepID=UPI00070000AC|nr:MULTISPECIES: hypothetical protein [unclassified Nocardioides]KRA29881.1 hypothetical protein ASD81_19400 [Nocardioides sp. Root614]KRA86802.1 hypothetical protein ASD84_21615 [Nocardioides sp. Root682]